MLFRSMSAFMALLIILTGLVACGDATPTSPAASTTAAGGTAPGTTQGNPTATLPQIPADQTVSISFVSYNFGTPGLGGKGVQQLIDEFQTLHPNIKVVGRNAGITDFLKTIVAEAAAGNPPDLAQLALPNLDYAVSNLPLQAINKIAPQAEYAEYTKHILPQALKLGIYNGNLYAGAYTFSTPTLFYNGDIFKAAGLDPAKPPATWDEVRQYSQQIKARTDKFPIAVDTFPGGGDWVIQSLINSNGGTTLSADKTKATFNQAPAIEVFKMWQGLVNDGLQPKIGFNDAIAAMSNGTLGMYISSTVLLPSLISASNGKWDLRTGAEPAFGTKTVRPVNSGSGLYLMSKDPLKQRAAWEFIKFAGSQRGNTIITSVMGYLPLRDDVVNDPNFLKPFLDKEPRLQPALQQLGNLETWVAWPGANSSQAMQIYIQAAQDVVYNGQDAQKTMDTAAERVTQLLQTK